MSYLIIIIAALVLALVGMGITLDRVRASLAHQRFYLEAHLAKALAIRRHVVRIEADVLARVFKLDGRTLRNPKVFNAKPGRHPATVTPARRRKMGR